MGIGLIFLFLCSSFICASTQYYQYPYNYGYPVNNDRSRSPCPSSCGDVQPRPNCQYSRCSSRNQYPYYFPYSSSYPYYFNGNTGKGYNPYDNFFPGFRIPTSSSSSSSNPYANLPVVNSKNGKNYNPYGYLFPGYKIPSSSSPSSSGPYANLPVVNNNNGKNYNPYDFFFPGSRIPSSSSSSSDPYANVPVEIIDVDEAPERGVKAPTSVNSKDPYANVPVEIIDDDSSNTGTPDFWRNIPRLPKDVKSSSSNYSVSQGAMTSDSFIESKPIRAVITRTFQPARKNPIIDLDFVNGEEVNKKETEDNVTIITEPRATEPPTTESEDVSAVKSWFSN